MSTKETEGFKTITLPPTQGLPPKALITLPTLLRVPPSLSKEGKGEMGDIKKQKTTEFSVDFFVKILFIMNLFCLEGHRLLRRL